MPRHRERGFTLLEVLAGLVLSSLVLVSLNLAMSAIGRGVDKTRDIMGRQSAAAAAIGVFAADVTRIARIPRDGAAQPPQFLFDGSGRQIIYPLEEREGPTAGGLFAVELSVRAKDGNSQLVRARAPLAPGQPLDGPFTWGDEVVLLEGPYDIAFAYRAPQSGDRSWSEGWPSGTMPEQIRLTITDRATDRLVVPVFVQPLAVDAEIACAGMKGPPCGPVRAEGAAQ